MKKSKNGKTITKTAIVWSIVIVSLIGIPALIYGIASLVGDINLRNSVNEKYYKELNYAADRESLLSFANDTKWKATYSTRLTRLESDESAKSSRSFENSEKSDFINFVGAQMLDSSKVGESQSLDGNQNYVVELTEAPDGLFGDGLNVNFTLTFY